MAFTTAQRNAVNSWLSTAWGLLQTRQATYLANRGTYRQFKRSHLLPVTAGAVVAPNNLADQPTNEADGETLVVAGAGSWPCQVTCNVYDGPAGLGYEAVARVTGSGGEVWRICRQSGPETWREHGWQQEVAG